MADGSEPQTAAFERPDDLRAWLEEHHESAAELWVRLARKDSGLPSITWPELVDEVLCFGWIDGHMKPIDDVWRRQRITPRREGSNWSARNVERVRILTEEGRMRPAGLAAFAARKDAGYTYEAPRELSPEYAARLEAATEASAFLERQIPSYRRNCATWVMSAKREDTRERRLGQLIDCSARGEPIPPFRWASLKA